MFSQVSHCKSINSRVLGSSYALQINVGEKSEAKLADRVEYDCVERARFLNYSWFRRDVLYEAALWVIQDSVMVNMEQTTWFWSRFVLNGINTVISLLENEYTMRKIKYRMLLVIWSENITIKGVRPKILTKIIFLLVIFIT